MPFIWLRLKRLWLQCCNFYKYTTLLRNFCCQAATAATAAALIRRATSKGCYSYGLQLCACLLQLLCYCYCCFRRIVVAVALCHCHCHWIFYMRSCAVAAAAAATLVTAVLYASLTAFHLVCFYTFPFYGSFSIIARLATAIVNNCAHSQSAHRWQHIISCHFLFALHNFFNFLFFFWCSLLLLLLHIRWALHV